MSQRQYPLGPTLEFLECLWHVNHAMERVSARMSRDLGITGAQRLAIRCIGKYPGLTAGQLAAMLHLDRGTISSALGRLEEKGLLERRADPNDGRRVTLGLTQGGRELDRPMERTIEAVVEGVLGDAEPADLEAARRLLGHLARALEQVADVRDEGQRARRG